MKEWFKSEDWAAVWIGLVICALALFLVTGIDVLGWAVSTNIWLAISEALVPVSKTYADLSGLASLFVTYLFLLGLMSLGAWLLGLKLRAFALGFSIIFWSSFLCWLIGNNA